MALLMVAQSMAGQGPARLGSPTHVVLPIVRQVNIQRNKGLPPFYFKYTRRYRGW